MKNNQTIYFVLGITLLSFGATWLFTRQAFFKAFDFSATGQIGDTIGGITAPLINIIGSILVYLSFKEQFRANQIQAQALRNEISRNRLKSNADVILNLYREAKEDFNAIEYEGLKGTNAVERMINTGAIHRDINFDYYLGILYKLMAINEKTEEDELDRTDKDYIKNVSQLFYLSKIKSNFLLLYEVSKSINSNGLPHLNRVKQNFEKYAVEY